jgi:Arrestin (or S-antigen), C-terminal domain
MMTEQQHGLVNDQWYMDHEIQISRCFCFKSSYTMRLQAQLNKELFYPDEQVIVEFEVDNSRSERDIKQIRCSLKHNISIRKAHEQLQNISNVLYMIENNGVAKNKRQDQ